MDVRMPDGYIVRGVPEGTPKEEIMARYTQWRVGNMKALDTADYSPTSGMSAPQRFAAGAGKAVYDLGRGAGQMLGLVSNEDVAASKATDAPLMDTTAGKFGNFAGNVAAAAPAAFVPGANTVAGAGVIGAGLGLLQPAESATERLTNTAIGGALGAGGQKVGQAAAKAIGGKIGARNAAASTAQAENAVRDATIRESVEAGYVLPPATINQGSKAAVAAESLSGKAATAQTAAFRNQRVTNGLIRSDLGLKGNGQTSAGELAAVRKQAGKVYDQIAKSGRVTADQQYLNEISNLGSVMDDVAADFPGAKAPSGDQIRELADSLFQQDFDAGTAIKYIRSLREQARDGFKSAASAGGNAEGIALARAKQEAAGALEDMVMRHLRATGKTSLADAFEGSRIRIAKAHDAEVALNPATGNFEASKLGAKLRKGKPIGGNFEKVAKFAAAFPESAREMRTGPGVSALSAVLSTGAGTAGVLSGNPAMIGAAAIPLARSASREAILSQMGQLGFMPNYVPNNLLLEAARRGSLASAPVAIGLGNTE